MAHLLRAFSFVKVTKDRFHGNRQCIEVQGNVVMCRKEWHLVLCQNWAGTDPMLTTSAGFQHTLTRHVYRDCMSARAWQRGHCQVMGSLPGSLYQTHFTGINWWATRWATWCRISLTNFCESSHRTFSFRVHERTPLKWRLPQSATSCWFSVENVQVTDATIWEAGSREQDAR